MHWDREDCGLLILRLNALKFWIYIGAENILNLYVLSICCVLCIGVEEYELSAFREPCIILRAWGCEFFLTFNVCHCTFDLIPHEIWSGAIKIECWRLRWTAALETAWMLRYNTYQCIRCCWSLRGDWTGDFEPCKGLVYIYALIIYMLHEFWTLFFIEA